MSDTPKFEVIDRRKFKAEEEHESQKAAHATESEPRHETPRAEAPSSGPRLVVNESKSSAEHVPVEAASAGLDEGIQEPGSDLPPAPTAEESRQQKLAYDASAQRLGELIRAQNPAAGAQPASRGRHSGGEDPLTSDAFSVRSSTDSRSYRSARQSSGLSRDQYEAALAQETQTFSLNDPPSGGYPAQQQYEAPRGRRHADERSSGSYPVQPPARPAETGGYSRDGYASPASQYSYGQPAPAPPYGDSFDYQDDARRPVPARESAARESAVSGRPPRPVYSSGSHRVPYDPRGGERRLTGRARRRHHLVYRAAAS